MECEKKYLSERDKFYEWLKEEKKKGLIDFKLYPSNNATASVESFYAELNSINQAVENKRFEIVTDL